MEWTKRAAYDRGWEMLGLLYRFKTVEERQTRGRNNINPYPTNVENRVSS